ncbi:hypothetical protein [Paenibacillus dendrobii]|uniref:hypothetical protein n=1 Tax=Paenibacillus dendrobii TaxID=2691084 RepID=UPI001F2E9059|nr:hypothetical protein [Paenibacillus dendrobii]
MMFYIVIRELDSFDVIESNFYTEELKDTLNYFYGGNKQTTYVIKGEHIYCNSLYTAKLPDLLKEWSEDVVYISEDRQEEYNKHLEKLKILIQ